MNPYHDEKGQFTSGPGGMKALKSIKDSEKGQDAIHAMAEDARIKGYARASIRAQAHNLQSEAGGTNKAYQAQMTPRFVAKAAAMHAAAIKVNGSAVAQMAAVRQVVDKIKIRVLNEDAPSNGGWGRGPKYKNL